MLKFEIYGVCMGIYLAMYFVMLWGTEIKFDMGKGVGPPSHESIISKWPQQRSSKGQDALQMPYDYQIW